MRIAFFSSLNPKPSGISDYSEALLPHLATQVDQVDVFIEDYEPSIPLFCDRLRVRHYREFEPEYRAGRYDAVLYHIGNNPYHVYIYDLALRIPGVLVLHEFNLHHLLANVTIARQDWEGYFQEVEYNAGPAALERAQKVREGLQEPDYDNIAMNRRLLEQSRGAIVHSDYVVRQVQENGFLLPLRKIQHGVEIPAVDAGKARRRLARLAGFSLDNGTPVLGVFGFLKSYKRIHEVLRAFARLCKLYPKAKLVLVGEEHPQYPLRPLISELAIDDAVRILGYVDLETFVDCMAACDICVNLRGPTAGETSGSFLRALALGKPTLVSEIGTFLELPDDVAVKIPVTGREIDWLFEYMRILLEEPVLARAIGERGLAYAAQECSWPKVAAEYVEFLKQCADREPVRSNSEPKPASGVAEENSSRTDVSQEELEEYIVGFSHASPMMEEYVLLHRKRLARTVEITPAGRSEDRVLELGCYLHLTPALRKYLRYGEVRGAYYGPAGRTDYRAATAPDGEVFACPIDLFDVERDPFPYADGYFQTVLCCELLEHLAADPMHMMAEINRILAPGGHLVLSTPNVTSLRSVHAVLLGYHPGLFHAYIKPDEEGRADPRHSREYAPREVALLLEAAGLQVILLETGDYRSEGAVSESTGKLLEANQFPPELRGEIIYCVGRKVGPVRERWPKELYYFP